MQIKILGTGCPKCRQLEERTRKVLQEMEIESEIDSVKDIKKIMDYPILTTPGLVINEVVVSSGKVPSEKEITGFINTALKK
ncbi:MAG: thioredoxin family protein [Dehalococcoidales bacterium]